MITIGVDPAKAVNEAAVLDAQGKVVGRWRGANDASGWAALVAVVAEHGTEREWAIECAGSYGRGLAQALVAAGESVYDVSPHLTAAGRRRLPKRGKTDGQDAEAAARVVRSHRASLPMVGPEDETTVLSLLHTEREALKAESVRVQNQLHAQLLQLDPQYKAHGLKALKTQKTLAQLKSYPAPADDIVAQARAMTVQRLGARLEVLLTQVKAIGRQMEQLARRLAPLKRLKGVDWLTAAQLGATLGPGQRFRSEAAFAAFNGTAPLDASSGQQVRHRLNRSGNREANAIIHRIAITQRRSHAPARECMARRRREGKTELEAMRALKRHVSRAVFNLWNQCFPSPAPA